ncbi:ABC transporter ATP-binding protein [Spiroplasma gladiatoris]|uniref:ABC transporter ATP-binding protein n=1 Tax=Spiroplasma gladiatoris TaxID=2143 RepID=A0A4P7AK73_9MOLU|nr:ABC transporter ATP-binding protein [Spiroplasma gladiatoris]QBQ08066.1 ABC transporter ATP-binding protein [Spiroplasma gladiatoris]
MTKITNKYWYLILMYAFLTTLSNASIVYGGYKLSSVLNNVVANNIDIVTKNTIIVLVSFIISILLNYISDLIKVKAIYKIKVSLKDLISKKINSLNDIEFQKYKKGDYISWYTNDVNSIENLCINNIFNVVKSISAIILSTYAIFTFHWIIGLSLFGTTLLMIILPSLVQSWVTKSTKKMSVAKENFSSRVENLISGYYVFSYANEKRKFYNLINLASKKEEKAISSYGYANSFQGFILFALFIASQMIMLFVSIYLALNNYTEVGAVLSVANISGTFFNGVNGLFGSAFVIKAGSIIVKKFKPHDVAEENIEKIDFKNLKLLNLSYEINNKQIFDNLNLEFKKDEKYLIVGESGKGKSTLFNIIFGLIDNYSGKILLNNELNYKSVGKENIKNLIWYMPQKTFIFNDTLKNNLTLFNEDVSNEKIIEVLKKVNLEKLANLESLEKIISIDTNNLSGGEMQRISIARALLQDRQILIFDEITSNLDKNNRDIIEEIIKSMNKTILYISHTSNTINNNNFDKVIEL